jgi:hypothetical protein
MSDSSEEWTISLDFITGLEDVDFLDLIGAVAILAEGRVEARRSSRTVGVGFFAVVVRAVDFFETIGDGSGLFLLRSWPTACDGGFDVGVPFAALVVRALRALRRGVLAALPVPVA